MNKKSVFCMGIVFIMTILTIACTSTGNSNSSSSSTSSSSRGNSGSDLFIVKESIEKDISGDITIYRMGIYNSGVVINQLSNKSGITTFSLMKKVSGNIQVNQFEVMYVGGDWIFMENIQLKIDENIFTLTVENPVRQVMRGNVLEILSPVLTNEIIDAFKQCSSIIVQVNGRSRGEPITIDPIGIPIINNYF